MWLDNDMNTTTARPYKISAVDAKGYARWAGRRTRTFATVDAARLAAFQLAAVLAVDQPGVVAVEVRFTNGAASGPVVERVEVEAV